MDNLKKTMNYVCEYAEKNALEKDNRDYKSLKNENRENTDYNKRSTF